jgi:hypothetical protein
VQREDVSERRVGECRCVISLVVVTCNLILCYSIRAWRGVRYNKDYADKLEKKLAKQKRERALPMEPTKSTQKANPFAVRPVLSKSP